MDEPDEPPCPCPCPPLEPFTWITLIIVSGDFEIEPPDDHPPDECPPAEPPSTFIIFTTFAGAEEPPLDQPLLEPLEPPLPPKPKNVADAVHTHSATITNTYFSVIKMMQHRIRCRFKNNLHFFYFSFFVVVFVFHLSCTNHITKFKIQIEILSFFFCFYFKPKNYFRCAFRKIENNPQVASIYYYLHFVNLKRFSELYQTKKNFFRPLDRYQTTDAHLVFKHCIYTKLFCDRPPKKKKQTREETKKDQPNVFSSCRCNLLPLKCPHQQRRKRHKKKKTTTLV